MVVEILLPIAVQVNPLFRQAIREASNGKTDQLKSDLEKASLLVKCIRQRNHTMVRMMHHLAILQRDFILNGNRFLVPMTRAALAHRLGVHESTISRAVSTKTVELPEGRIIPIATFFDRSLPIRTAVKEIIAQEKKPLSDNKIVAILSERGYDVARRTVAKYRSMERILPAHLRRRNVQSSRQ